MTKYNYVFMDNIGAIIFMVESEHSKAAIKDAREQLQDRFKAKHPSLRMRPFTMAVGLEEEEFFERKAEILAMPEDYNPREMNGEGYSGWTFDWTELPADKEKTDASAGL